MFRCANDFRAKYGMNDTWVVVTGGSDGIGLEICEQMAA
jgi:short-subunit dehydrogenase